MAETNKKHADSPAFRKGYAWNPVSMDFLFSNYKLTSSRIIFPMLFWAFLIILFLFLTADLLHQNWFSVTESHVHLINFFVLNPALIAGILLLFWFGFEWGFIPVYLCTFIVAYTSGISVMWSSLIGVSFIMGMGFIALAYYSTKIPYSLRSLKSVAVFVVVSFLAALASSMGSFIWSFSHQLSAYDTMVVWKSWWTGVFFQSVLIVGPALFFFSPVIEKRKEWFFQLPSQPEVSVNWIYGAIISITLTLGLFIFSGYLLGRLNMQEMAAGQNMVTGADLMGSLEAFEIITWTSIGIIIISGFTAIYLLNNWNRTLQNEVDNRTKDLEVSRKELKKSLEEKDVLFEEIQHRVKNNLAQVHGLLELQETMSDDPEISDLLKVSKSRIRTMSLAHEALYNNRDFSKISLKDYIEHIARVTHDSFKDSSKNTVLRYDIEDLHLDMAKAIPLGLMISEILINAHKHAFNDQDEGTVQIVTEIKNGKLYLSIADNGCGIPEGVDVTKSNSLGMILVESFTEQMKADLKINSNSNGTRYAFEIPLKAIISVEEVPAV
jgi:two-component sensor histidine kinase